jgi:hypothetical protein
VIRGRHAASALIALAVTAAGCSADGRSEVPAQPQVKAAAFVVSSAHHTLAQRGVELQISGTITAAGQPIKIAGIGQANLKSRALRLSAQMQVGDRTVTMRELFWRGHFYIGLDQPGRSMRELTGHDWSELPINLRGAPGATTDPLQAIAMLERHGAKVKQLGQSIVNGRRVLGYAVTPSKNASAAAVRRMLKPLPAAQRAAVLETIRRSPPPTIDIWFDPARHLLRRMTTQMSLSGFGSTASGSVTVDFIHYGAPVRITGPRAGDVISYPRLLKVLSR